MQIRPDIAADASLLTEWRQDIHRHPELGYEESRTSRLVAERLASFGLEVVTGLGGTGVVGKLHGEEGAGSIGLRADMDALPMQEMGESDHKSEVDGVFHGCGHDGHTTMLLGAAKSMGAARDGRREGPTVHFIFQPAEEGLAGARAMMDDGLFERFPCDEVYGVHNWPDAPFGTACVGAGPMMAASDKIEIEITGKGAHAAMPHKGVDPVLVASHVVTALQSLVSRGTDPVDAAVVSVTKIEAGSAFNVIPETATLGGTVRTFRPETRDRLEAEIERTAVGIARAMGCEARVEYSRGYPPTVNHAGQSARFAEAACRLLGDGQVSTDPEPCMGGEDFAFMLEEVPGSYLWLGQGGEYNVHHPRYDFDDRLLPVGANLWVELVEGFAASRRG